MWRAPSWARTAPRPAPAPRPLRPGKRREGEDLSRGEGCHVKTKLWSGGGNERGGARRGGRGYRRRGPLGFCSRRGLAGMSRSCWPCPATSCRTPWCRVARRISLPPARALYPCLCRPEHCRVASASGAGRGGGLFLLSPLLLPPTHLPCFRLPPSLSLPPSLARSIYALLRSPARCRCPGT